MDITMMDEQLLEKAFIELRKSRLHHCAHVSIWDFSHHWRTLKPQILKKLHMKRVEIKCGQYISFEQGKPKGCSPSPLIAPLDKQRQYMDDWIVLVKTRSELRKVIKITHRVLKSLKLRMHPKKTFIGCIQKGFAFLGIQWNKVPKIAKQSIENHQIKLALRYAQDASKNGIGDYLKRWNLWCRSVLNCCMDETHNNNTIFPCNTN